MAAALPVRISQKDGADPVEQCMMSMGVIKSDRVALSRPRAASGLTSTVRDMISDIGAPCRCVNAHAGLYVNMESKFHSAVGSVGLEGPLRVCCNMSGIVILPMYARRCLQICRLWCRVYKATAANVGKSLHNRSVQTRKRASDVWMTVERRRRMRKRSAKWVEGEAAVVEVVVVVVDVKESCLVGERDQPPGQTAECREM